MLEFYRGLTDFPVQPMMERFICINNQLTEIPNQPNMTMVFVQLNNT
jgi:hypothetical protein